MLGCKTRNSAEILVFSCHSLQKWHSSSRHQPPTKKNGHQKDKRAPKKTPPAYGNPLKPQRPIHPSLGAFVPELRDEALRLLEDMEFLEGCRHRAHSKLQGSARALDIDISVNTNMNAASLADAGQCASVIQ